MKSFIQLIPLISDNFWKVVGRPSVALTVALLLGLGVSLLYGEVGRQAPASAQTGGEYTLLDAAQQEVNAALTGGSYTINWQTEDGGGQTSITGGAYTLLNTAGQPDAENAVEGGGYTLFSGFWPGSYAPDEVPIPTIYLPLIWKAEEPTGPDLVISSFTVSPSGPNFSAGQAVTLEAVVTNQGDAWSDTFWVDLFINPTQALTVNTRWNDACTLSPCYGIAWFVSGGLDPGQSVTLTSNAGSYQVAYSRWPGYFAAGTTSLTLYADVWNPGVVTGGVTESDEGNNTVSLNDLTVTSLEATQRDDLPLPSEIPERPARLEIK
jgi:hypothetical protein